MIQLAALISTLYLATSVFAAQNPHLGTWTLNEAKSTLTPGTSKYTRVVFADAGERVHVTIEGVTADGRPTRNEWTGAFDGKDYPVTMDDRAVGTRAYTKIDDRTLEFISKTGGRITLTGRIVVASDGKSWTVTESGADPHGTRFSIQAVFDKQ